MSAWDRVKGWFRRDKRAAKRREYAGAKRSRRTSDWIAQGTSGNAELGLALPLLRQRSRQAWRDDPHAKSSLSTLASYFSGVMPRSAIPIPVGASDAERERIEALNREVDDRHREWSRRCSSRGPGSYRGTQYQAVLGMLMSGETFTRRRIRRPGRLVVPMQLELLEGDLCDHTKSERLEDGGWILQGIEHSPIGRVRAYHLYREHPGESTIGGLSFGSSLDTVAVPAAAVAHLYPEMLSRPQQVRGEPWLHANLQGLHDLAGYLDSERVRLRAAASFMGAVTTEEDITYPDEESEDDDHAAYSLNAIRDCNGDVVERVRPGEIVYLRGGQTMTFNKPPSSDGFAEYVKTDLHTQAAGALMPYELYTGDLSDTNFSSIMFGMGSFKRFARRMVEDVVVARWADPVWGWFVEAGRAAGSLPPEAGPVAWTVEPWPLVDPVKEARGNQILVRSGAKSLRRWIAETGEDPEEVLRDHESIARWASDHGIVLDSIPTSATLAGQIQEGFGIDSDPE